MSSPSRAPFALCPGASGHLDPHRSPAGRHGRDHRRARHPTRSSRPTWHCCGPQGRPHEWRPASARTIVIAHNVLPHEARPGDRQLLTAFFSRVDSVVVHSDAQARLATELGARHVRELDLPPHLPGGPAITAVPGDGRTRILALGIVRDYKGVDLLLEAAKEVRTSPSRSPVRCGGDAGRTVKGAGATHGSRTGSRSTGICPRRPDPRVARPARRPGPSPTAMPRRPRTSCSPAATACPSSRRRSAPSPSRSATRSTACSRATRRRAGLTAALTRLPTLRMPRSCVPACVPSTSRGPGHYVGALEALASAESDAIGDRPVPPPANSIGGRVQPGRRSARSAAVDAGPRAASHRLPRLIRTVRRPHLDSDAVDARQSAADLAPQVRRRGGCLGGARCPGRHRADHRRRWRRDAVIVDESGTRARCRVGCGRWASPRSSWS